MSTRARKRLSVVGYLALGIGCDIANAESATMGGGTPVASAREAAEERTGNSPTSPPADVPVAADILPAESHSCGGVINSCYWEACSHTATVAGTAVWKCGCDDAAGFHVVSGSCFTDDTNSTLVRTNPYENSDHTDYIDDDECVGPYGGNNSPDGVTGWACVQRVSAGAVTKIGVVCCDL